MIRLLCIVLVVFFFGACSVDMTPSDSNTYIKFVGGSRDENIKAIQPTSDGGFIMVGSTASFRDKVQDLDFYVAKIDINGNKQWYKNWGLTKTDEANAVVEMPNGDFWVLGYSTDTLETNNGRTDFTLLVLSQQGSLLDTLYLSTPNVSTQGKSITRISDAETILVGNINQPEPSNQSIDMKAYKLKTDRSVSGSYSLGLLQTDDVLVGMLKDAQNLLWLGNIKRKVQSPTPVPNRIRLAVSNLFGTVSDDYIFREQENIQANDEAKQIIYLSDSQEYVVVGTSSDLSGNNKDVILLKFSMNAPFLDDTSISFKKIENLGEEEGKGIYATSDGGFIIVGTKLVNNEDTDIYLLKVNAEGKEQWSKTFGGTGLDEGVAVRETPDGCFLVVANVWFKNNKVVGLYKTDKQGIIFK
jgi:hypothetical protein